MNRVIIVGNGFDLAHQMKTDYLSFITNYIKASFLFAKSHQKFDDEFMTIERQGRWNGTVNIDTLQNLNDFKIFLFPQKSNAQYNFLDVTTNSYSREYEFKWQIKNQFIEHLFTKCFHLTWVDIENEYYVELKKILDLDDVKKKSQEVLKLNSAFNYLIKILKTYLLSLKPANLNWEYQNLLQEEIKKKDLVDAIIEADVLPQRILILNFNYTNTIVNYIRNSTINNNNIDYSVIHIHGQLNDQFNPIIFGFGDELDKSYQRIEEEKVKGFLNYVKSFWYFKTSNYYNLIRFIDSDLYQVYILGHSCGLSDRTMLNMIFEHDNCKSVKIFYHEIGTVNNYEELTQEISRHFSNKGEMRKKIVSFDKSNAMPQLE